MGSLLGVSILHSGHQEETYVIDVNKHCTVHAEGKDGGTPDITVLQ
jgi:hypothetical protein